MSKSKIDFISDLLANKRLDPSMKQKFFELAAKELKIETDTHTHPEITNRLNEIEKKLGTIIVNETRVELSEKAEVSLAKYTNPSHLSKFLIAYNQDPVLKYTCHNIDDLSIIQGINELCKTTSYDFVKHQELIERRYREFQDKFFVNHKIKNLILVYLSGNSYSGNYQVWSSENIEVNWKSIELIEWSKNNPGIVPNPGVNLINVNRNRGYKLTNTIKSELTGKRINYFSELVFHFKNLFHIRGDNSLKSLVEKVNETLSWDQNITFEIPNSEFNTNIELFTDVDKLLEAYGILIKLILDVKDRFKLEKPRVKLTFREDGKNIEFAIHHVNSFYRKTILNTVNGRSGQSEKQLIPIINGLCDMYLRANFDNGEFAEINFWNGKKRKADQLNDFQGVEYVLKFKK